MKKGNRRYDSSVKGSFQYYVKSKCICEHTNQEAHNPPLIPVSRGSDAHFWPPLEPIFSLSSKVCPLLFYFFDIIYGVFTLGSLVVRMVVDIQVMGLKQVTDCLSEARYLRSDGSPSPCYLAPLPHRYVWLADSRWWKNVQSRRTLVPTWRRSAVEKKKKAFEYPKSVAYKQQTLAGCVITCLKILVTFIYSSLTTWSCHEISLPETTMQTLLKPEESLYCPSHAALGSIALCLLCTKKKMSWLSHFC